jgi:hypothetical protein
LIDTIVFYVGDDTNDNKPIALLTDGRRSAKGNLFSQRILAREILFCERFVDDANMRRVLIIMFGEETAGELSHAHGAHSVGRDAADIGGRILAGFGQRSTSNSVTLLRIAEQRVFHSNRLNPGKHPQFDRDLVEEGTALHVILVTAIGQ